MLPGGFSTADQTDCTYRLFFKVIVWSLQGDGKLVSRIKLCHYKTICSEVLVLGQRDCIVQWEDCIHLLGLLWKLQKWETKTKGCQIDYMIRLGSKIRSRKSGSCQMATESFLSFFERYQRRTWSWDGFQDTAIGLGKKMFDSWFKERKMMTRKEKKCFCSREWKASWQLFWYEIQQQKCPGLFGASQHSVPTPTS